MFEIVFKVWKTWQEIIDICDRIKENKVNFFLILSHKFLKKRTPLRTYISTHICTISLVQSFFLRDQKIDKPVLKMVRYRFVSMAFVANILGICISTDIRYLLFHGLFFRAKIKLDIFIKLYSRILGMRFFYVHKAGIYDIHSEKWKIVKKWLVPVSVLLL